MLKALIIMLTLMNGDPIWIGAGQIVRMNQTSRGCELYMSDGRTYTIKEDCAIVVGMVNHAQ